MANTKGEPAAKKQKTEDWAGHKLNIENAVVKASEGKKFAELAESNIQVLQGIGPKHDEILESLHLATVKDMATFKFYLAAKAVQTLSTVEGSFRPEGSAMNVDNLVDQAYEAKSFMELLEAPISALQGLTEKAETTLSGMGVKTIGDLAGCKVSERQA
jgi:predicted flap endonuclease-1-like 5' DNA nuclease